MELLNSIVPSIFVVHVSQNNIDYIIGLELNDIIADNDKYGFIADKCDSLIYTIMLTMKNTIL